MLRTVLSYILAALLLLPTTVLAWNGQVTEVMDGDTFDAMRNGEEVTIRLYGIDCLEYDQPHGGEAEKFLGGIGGRARSGRGGHDRSLREDYWPCGRRLPECGACPARFGLGL